MVQTISVFHIDDHQFRLPEGYVPTERIASDPPDAVTFTKDLPGLFIHLALFERDIPCAFIRENPMTFLMDLYDRMEKNQGLVDFKMDETPGGYPFLFTIIKSTMDVCGIQYAQTIQLDLGGKCLVAQGFFNELEFSATREVHVRKYATDHHLLTGPKAIPWFREPFPVGRRSGCPRSLAEDEQFDQFFPEDPLTELRCFTRDFLTNN